MHSPGLADVHLRLPAPRPDIPPRGIVAEPRCV